MALRLLYWTTRCHHCTLHLTLDTTTNVFTSPLPTGHLPLFADLHTSSQYTSHSSPTITHLHNTPRRPSHIDYAQLDHPPTANTSPPSSTRQNSNFNFLKGHRLPPIDYARLRRRQSSISTIHLALFADPFLIWR